ncbi:MAG: DUF4388 domain-containing protein [Actinobacteria bacterium]|nr:DUF4388 domain-containing protein [Actinomycetota bacterium]
MPGRISVALEGNLRDFSLEDMFRLLASGNKSGTLHMERDGSEGRVCFKKGRVFFASSNWNRESLGRRLVKTAVISEKQLRQALGLQKIQKKEKANRRLGQILVDEGYLESRVLEGFIQDQINDTLFDLFRWEDGELRFESGESCDDEDIGISVSVENIIMESARRLELWNRIRIKIPSLDTRFIMASAPGDKSMEIHLKPKEWMLLCFLHGSRTVRELVELTGYNDFDTAKILYVMYSAGLIERLGATDEALPTE